MSFRYPATVVTTLLWLGCQGVPAASATTTGAPGPSLTAILHDTEYAFAGDLARRDSFRDSVSGLVVTRFVFRNLRMAYGEAPGDSLDMRSLGGFLEGRGHSLDVLPAFEVGRRYIAFLPARRGGEAGWDGIMVGTPAGTFCVDGAGSEGMGRVRTIGGFPLVAVSDDHFDVVERVNARPGGSSFGAGSAVRTMASPLPSVEALTEKEFLSIMAARIRAAKARPPANR